MYPTPPSPNAPYDPPLGPPSPQWPPPQGPPIPPPPPSVPPARVKHPRKPVLPVRPVNRPIALVVAAIAGLATDVVGHAGLVSVSGTALFMCLSAGLLATGRLRGRAAKVMVLLGGALGLVLAVRTSDWVVIPVMATAVILLLVGASIGSDTTGVPRTPSEALIRTAISACHLAIAPGVLRPLADTDKDNTTRHKHWPALLRGVLLALLVAAPLTSLLASADPVFRSWLDLSRAATHVALILGGAWLLLGLVRSSSSARDVPTVSAKASVGKIEATCALGTVAALYSVFVVAQLVALSDAGHRILTTRNLTYAQYARSGFFQLLACAALTLVVLLILRPHTRPDAHPSRSRRARVRPHDRHRDHRRPTIASVPGRLWPHRTQARRARGIRLDRNYVRTPRRPPFEPRHSLNSPAGSGSNYHHDHRSLGYSQPSCTSRPDQPRPGRSRT